MSDDLPDSGPGETAPVLPPPPVSAAPPVASAATAPATAAPQVSALTVLKALADPVRYELLKAMAGGEVLTVIGMARRLKAHPDTIGKHVKVLRRARVIRRVKSEGADGRVKEFQIPKECRQVPRELDFGVCVVRLEE